MSVRITADRASLIDEAGRIQEELAAEDAAHSAKTAVRRARAAVLDVEILKWFDGEPAEAEPVASGEHFTAAISAKGNRSEIIDIQAVARKLGRRVFLENADIPLGELRRLIPKAEHEEFIRTERTGNRSMTLVRKSL